MSNFTCGHQINMLLKRKMILPVSMIIFFDLEGTNKSSKLSNFWEVAGLYFSNLRTRTHFYIVFYCMFAVLFY